MSFPSTLLCFAHIWLIYPALLFIQFLNWTVTLRCLCVSFHLIIHPPMCDAAWTSFGMTQSNVMDQGLIVKLEAKCPGQEQMVSLCFVGCDGPQANSLTSMSSGRLECAFARFAPVAHSWGGHCLSSIFQGKNSTKCLNNV